jgi:pyrimidine operon attenuation protein / uracil phosphoribosyltransferase
VKAKGFFYNLGTMQPKVIINSKAFKLTLKRLCYQLIEQHDDFSDTVLIGVQPRGSILGERIQQELKNIAKIDVPLGKLDITFFRDDFRRTEKPLTARATEINFQIENKKVVLVDDVLYTGRTIRAAMDAMLVYGRPSSVELLVFVDRRFTRNLPIEATYVGRSVDSIDSQRVSVEWAKTEGEDKVLMFSTDKEK